MVSDHFDPRCAARQWECKTAWSHPTPEFHCRKTATPEQYPVRLLGDNFRSTVRCTRKARMSSLSELIR